MKNWTWREWTLFGVALAAVITCVVFFFASPKFFYFTTGLIIGGLAGIIAGYYVGKRKTVEKTVTQD